MADPVPSEQSLTGQNAPVAAGNRTHAAQRQCGNTDAPDNDAPDNDAPDNEQSLRTEVTQLRRAMETRPTIDKACGMLMATFGLTPQAAWSVLVTTSQNTNTKLHRLADDLVETTRGDPLPREVQEQLAAAVSRMKGDPSANGSAS